MRLTRRGLLGLTLGLALLAPASRADDPPPVKDRQVRPADNQPPAKDDKVRPADLEQEKGQGQVEYTGQEHVMVIDSGLQREGYRYRQAKITDGKTTRLVWQGPFLIEDKQTQRTFALGTRPDVGMAYAAFEGPGGGEPGPGAALELTLRSGEPVKGTLVREDADWLLIDTGDAVVSVRQSNVVMARWPKSKKAATPIPK